MSQRISTPFIAIRANACSSFKTGEAHEAYVVVDDRMPNMTADAPGSLAPSPNKRNATQQNTTHAHQ